MYLDVFVENVSFIKLLDVFNSKQEEEEQLPKNNISEKKPTCDVSFDS